MKSIINFYKHRIGIFILLMACIISACTPDEEDYELGPKVESAFTVTDISTEEMKNTFLLESSTQEAFLYRWDLGNGTIHTGNSVDTVFYDTKGTYTVKLTVASAGGQSTFEQDIVVAEDAIEEGEDLIVGGDMEDENAWTITNVGLAETTTAFTDGVLKFSNGEESAQTNIGVWQAVDVEAGQSYKFSASVNDPGSTGSWIEFYLGTTEPADGTDYTDNKIPSGTTITFDESGIIYVLIKVGSWDGNLGSEGVSVDNVKLVEVVGAPLVEGDDILKGGSLTSDEFWTVSGTGGVATTTAFTEEGLKFSNEEDSNVAVWQAIDVVEGQQYKFSANVKGSGATNSWFEIYFGSTVPAEGSDYTDGGYTGLNTWAGCATSAFEGDIAILGCNDAPGTGAKGMISFEESGTVYLVIKAGSSGGTLGDDGITISDAKLLEMN